MSLTDLSVDEWSVILPFLYSQSSPSIAQLSNLSLINQSVFQSLSNDRFWKDVAWKLEQVFADNRETIYMYESLLEDEDEIVSHKHIKKREKKEIESIRSFFMKQGWKIKEYIEKECDLFNISERTPN